MIPRLTKRGRYFTAKGFIGPRCACRPSPAEKRKARESAMFKASHRIRKEQVALCKRMMPPFMASDYDEHERMIGMDDGFPPSRGTTAQQLTAMHLEAENEIH